MSIYRDGQVAARAADEARKAKRRLIGFVREASACDETWEMMPGDECTRRCHRCLENVFDIGAMTEAQVEDLVAAVEAGGATNWVRFSRRIDGRLLVGDCPDGVARVRRKRNHRIAGVVAAVLLLMGMRVIMLESINDPSADAPPDVKAPIGRAYE